MSKAFIVGDIHLKATSPISRRDDYPTVILEKLRYIADLAVVSDCSNILLLGDVFDSPTVSIPYLHHVVNTFRYIQSKGIKVYTIVGNHDIKNNRLESLSDTVLGLLLNLDLIKRFNNPLVIENTNFIGVDYPDDLPTNTSDLYSVMLCHRYYNIPLFSESLNISDIENLGFNCIIFGHYHAPRDCEYVNNCLLLHPGSLSRSSSELYNRTRIPRIISFDCINHSYSYLEIPCESGESVFITSNSKLEDVKLSMKELVDFMKSSYQASDLNIRDYLNDLDIPNDCKTRIKNYFDTLGF